LSEAGQALQNAPKFKELMSVRVFPLFFSCFDLNFLSLPQLILLIGNYMNGTGAKGGAFGFRVSSINKASCSFSLDSILLTIFLQLVDTKSVNNTTLLHFVERTVAREFPEMEGFLDELAAPAEAYRGTNHSPVSYR
jgi:cytokinesis protein